MWETQELPCASSLYKCSPLCCTDQQDLFLHDKEEKNCSALIYYLVLEISSESRKTTSATAWIYEVLQTNTLWLLTIQVTHLIQPLRVFLQNQYYYVTVFSLLDYLLLSDNQPVINSDTE